MGISDRQYMRGGGGGPRYFRRSGMDMIWKLIAANLIVYVAVSVKPELYSYLILTSESIRQFQLYRLITAAFLHVEFFHILLNMWGLYLFGRLVAFHLPQWKILALYLVGGLVGNLLFVVFNLQTSYALLGASGAVFGLTMAAAMLEPDQRFVIIFMPFWPLKTSTMVICYTVIELVSEMGGARDGIAHLAHLGGFLGGYLAVRFLYPGRTPWDPLRFLTGGARPAARSYRSREYREPSPLKEFDRRSGDGSRPVTQKELDYLLDKIASAGINSLSDDELARLRQAREQMKKP